ncbi:MAG: hypothetical protein J7M21_00735, partial [Planctomycetes bacterium]|nr:hypothetical protein [Planctomycetota bacterium]
SAERAAEMLRRRKLSLAVVAISASRPSRPGELALEVLVRLAGGRLVRRRHLAGLAEVFGELVRSARPAAVRRGRFFARADRGIFHLPPGALPEVRAYLPSAPTEGAEVLATVGREGDALLAVRRVGLGLSASLVLPPAGRDNPAWSARRGWADVLVELVRGVLRRPGDSRFTGRVERTGGRLVVTLDAADTNGPMNLLEPVGRIVAAGPAGAGERTFELRQVAPGRYRGESAEPAGPAALAVSVGGRDAWRAALPAAAPRELAAIGADWEKLDSLAELTGGRIADAGNVPARRLEGSTGRVAAWPVLLAAACAAMLAEWLLVRLRPAGAARPLGES